MAWIGWGLGEWLVMQCLMLIMLLTIILLSHPLYHTVLLGSPYDFTVTDHD